MLRWPNEMLFETPRGSNKAGPITNGRPSPFSIDLHSNRRYTLLEVDPNGLSVEVIASFGASKLCLPRYPAPHAPSTTVRSAPRAPLLFLSDRNPHQGYCFARFHFNFHLLMNFLTIFHLLSFYPSSLKLCYTSRDRIIFILSRRISPG